MILPRLNNEEPAGIARMCYTGKEYQALLNTLTYLYLT
jgi:hypothetical protein